MRSAHTVSGVCCSCTALQVLLLQLHCTTGFSVQCAALQGSAVIIAHRSGHYAHAPVWCLLCMATQARNMHACSFQR